MNMPINDFSAAMRDALETAMGTRRREELEVQASAKVIRVSLEHAGGVDWAGDALVVLQPAAPRSLDAKVGEGLRGSSSLAPGKCSLADAADAGVAAKHVLLLGTQPQNQFGYPQVKEAAVDLIASLAKVLPGARRVGMALPGVPYGLDDRGCLEAWLKGTVRALQSTEHQVLEELVLIEPVAVWRDALRAYLCELLDEPAPPGWNSKPDSWPLLYRSRDGGRSPGIDLESKLVTRLAAETDLTAFVAMPFAEEMRDTFIYGIKRPAQGVGFRAERLDFEEFSGDVVEQIRERIRRAHLVIADMTTANPNVFLEIGYAWGKERPTVLLWRKDAVMKNTASPPFDVLGQRRIDYRSIEDLEKKLSSALRALKSELQRRSEEA
jgi:hypothetical protein